LVVRAANLGGRLEAFADEHARPVTRHAPETIPTRHGDVRVQRYVPDGRSRRTTLLIPGIHSMGIEEPRLTALAADLAGAGVTVIAMALPDLQQYRIRPQATDVIEDAIAWVSGREDLAPDGRAGVIGVSFAGGLSIVAAGRPSVRERVAFIVSFGGHGDLRRVLRYLSTGDAPQVEGVDIRPPHDYGVAVILYGLADSGIVPAEQVAPLREGIYTFLHASQLTLVDMDQANATFERARQMAAALPEPSRTYLALVNDRDVARLGASLQPYLERLGGGDPALSPERSAEPPAAPVYLLHGDGDTVIPTAESALLARHLRAKGVTVHVLLSGLITHAEVNKTPEASEAMKLVGFWASVLRR
jgi:dienelactone hydrolase